MAGPRFLAENFFNIQQFSGHTITAEEETTGFEAWRVGAARRVGGRIRNYWTPTTANSSSWVEVECDRARAADMLVIDRGHNLDGEAVTIQVSDTAAFVTSTTIVSLAVVPSNVYSNSRLSDTPGVRTTEGAWAISFPTHVGKYWRLVVEAMGAGLKPQIPGMYLGNSFSPTNRPPRVWDDEPTQIVYQQIVSDSLWTSSSRKAKRREASIQMVLESELENDQARYHFRSRYYGGDVMWNVPDTDNAERAWLAEAPPGMDAMPFGNTFDERVVSLAMVEHNPKSDV